MFQKYSNGSTFPHNKWVKLNVGGKIFVTTWTTLFGTDATLNRSNSGIGGGRFFLNMDNNLDENGAYLIDRDPEYFTCVLNYLRHGKLIYDVNVNIKGILTEALFFGIESLVKQLETLVAVEDEEVEDPPLKRADVIKILLQTPDVKDLRLQGINMKGADLSNLDLHNVNFKYANMSDCNLAQANLSNCCFERTNLKNAVLEGAQLNASSGFFANMENANLRGCNFEDPNGRRPNFEGANLRGACLENCNLTGLNLRFVSLNDANLKNAILRSVLFLGGDLQGCDLTGADSRDADFRGANLMNTVSHPLCVDLSLFNSIGSDSK